MVAISRVKTVIILGLKSVVKYKHHGKLVIGSFCPRLWDAGNETRLKQYLLLNFLIIIFLEFPVLDNRIECDESKKCTTPTHGTRYPSITWLYLWCYHPWWEVKRGNLGGFSGASLPRAKQIVKRPDILTFGMFFIQNFSYSCKVFCCS